MEKKNKTKLYVASPLGFSEAGWFFMYHQFIPLIEECGYEILDPWKLTPQEMIEPVAKMPYGEEKKLAWQKLNRILGENNSRAIRESQGVVAVLDGPDVDSGTASEIGFASALGKPILGYRGDFRLASDNEGSVINLQVQYFIEVTGGTIVRSFRELEESLKKIFIP